jgi:hypothetical protein
VLVLVLVIVLDCFPHRRTEDDDHENDQVFPAFSHYRRRPSSSIAFPRQQTQDDDENEHDWGRPAYPEGVTGRSPGFGTEVVATIAEKARGPVQSRRVTPADTYIPCQFGSQLAVLPSFEGVLRTASRKRGCASIRPCSRVVVKTAVV